MDNAAGQTPAQRIPALKAESETLDTELFAAYQAKLVTKEERSQEDARIKRAREEHDRLLVCNRRKEDARRSLERLGEDEEHDRLKMAIMRKKIVSFARMLLVGVWRAGLILGVGVGVYDSEYCRAVGECRCGRSRSAGGRTAGGRQGGGGRTAGTFCRCAAAAEWQFGGDCCRGSS